MNLLFKERLKRHQTSQLKYLRLIFNDQFVIALIFLIGSLGFWYSNFLETLTNSFWWAKIVVALIATILVSVGHLATLLENADSTFLLAKEAQMNEYLKSVKKYSLIFPVVFLVVSLFIMYPFANIAAEMKMVDYLIFASSIIVIKVAMIEIEALELFSSKNYRYLILGLVFVVEVLALYTSIYGALLVAVVLLIAVMMQSTTGKLFNWYKAIKQEDARSFNVKKFYNLFTDVPGLSNKIVRRKYLDFIVNRVKLIHQNTYLYIYSRGFVRNNEYIGLFFRLVVIQAAILFFVKNVYLSAAIGGLFIYLVGFQLKPFYKQYANNLMQKIYPIVNLNKTKDFQKLVITVLTIQWVISLVPIFYIYGLTLNSLVVAGVELLVELIFGFILLPRDLKKLDE